MYFSNLIPLGPHTSSANCPEAITQNVNELSNSLVPSQGRSPLITAVSGGTPLSTAAHVQTCTDAHTVWWLVLFREAFNLSVGHTLLALYLPINSCPEHTNTPAKPHVLISLWWYVSRPASEKRENRTENEIFRGLVWNTNGGRCARKAPCTTRADSH